jgi:protein-tyrosine kinase
MRKPGVHAIFDLPNDRGLTTLLRRESASLDAVAQPTEQENLRILTSGPLPPNPSELIGSQRMRAVVDMLVKSETLVIFDSPPVEAVTDAAILGSFVDATLFVVDAQRSRRRAVRLARESLAKTGANVVGAVLNRVAARSRADDQGAYGDYYGSAERKGRTPDPSRGLPGPQS